MYLIFKKSVYSENNNLKKCNKIFIGNSGLELNKTETLCKAAVVPEKNDYTQLVLILYKKSKMV